MSNAVSPDSFDNSSIADLIAEYGSSTATSWLDSDRYKIWRPTEEIPESSFKPVQAYMQKDSYAFAWGNPLVSSPDALLPTARAFINYIESQELHPVWSCVDFDLEEVLACDEFGWSVVSCIYADIIDPDHLIELTSQEHNGNEGTHAVKDLKKNLRRGDKYGVQVEEFRGGPEEMAEEDKRVIDDGIKQWKERRNGFQIASSDLDFWLDMQHRRYWLARKDGIPIGFLILTPINGDNWQIKNAISFPEAPKGTSEALIYHAVKELYEERCQEQAPDNNSDRSSQNGKEDHNDDRTSNRISVTFDISAAEEAKPIHKAGGWKFNALSKTYKKITKMAVLLNRGEFRNKFDTHHEIMYVCYPPDGFGLDGVDALLKVLKK